MSEYQHFVEKCKRYGVVSKIPEETYLQLSEDYRELEFNKIVDSVLAWLEEKTLEELNDMRNKGAKKLTQKEIGSRRIRFFAVGAKEDKKKKEMDKYEYFQKQNEENESKRADSMKRKDEIARNKARVGEFEEPEDCKTPPDVLNWIAENKRFIPRMLERELKREQEEHPFVNNLSEHAQTGLAKARLKNLIKQNIT